MKINVIRTTKFALLCTAVAAASPTFTPSARALAIRDGHQLSVVNYGTASGDRTPYVNHLIGIARVTEAGVNYPGPQALPANYMNSGYMGDLRRVIQIPRPGVVPHLVALPPGGTATVPDGGITVMLLGTALSALGIARRYILS